MSSGISDDLARALARVCFELLHGRLAGAPEPTAAVSARAANFSDPRCVVGSGASVSVSGPEMGSTAIDAEERIAGRAFESRLVHKE